MVPGPKRVAQVSVTEPTRAGPPSHRALSRLALSHRAEFHRGGRSNRRRVPSDRWRELAEWRRLLRARGTTARGHSLELVGRGGHQFENGWPANRGTKPAA